MRKNAILTLMISLFFSQMSAAQTGNIMTYKGSWSSTYMYGMGEYSLSEAGDIFKRESPEAYKTFKKGRANKTFEWLTGIPGGFLVGYELGGLIRSRKVDAARGGIGLGLSALSFYFTYRSAENFVKAAEIFNNKKSTSLIRKFELNLTEANAVGLVFRF